MFIRLRWVHLRITSSGLPGTKKTISGPWAPSCCLAELTTLPSVSNAPLSGHSGCNAASLASILNQWEENYHTTPAASGQMAWNDRPDYINKAYSSSNEQRPCARRCLRNIVLIVNSKKPCANRARILARERLHQRLDAATASRMPWRLLHLENVPLEFPLQGGPLQPESIERSSCSATRIPQSHASGCLPDLHFCLCPTHLLNTKNLSMPRSNDE